ncbi:hypothetical protein BC833DRAFT_626280, partial [Globomyces pollinis-pini]
MENKAFFIQYLTNKPVQVETHYIGEHDRRRPLTNVAHLIAAYTAHPTRRLLGLPGDFGPLTLHLPEGVSRSALEDYCFATVDENDTTLDAGCPLSALGSLGSKSKQPLLIKSVSVRINDFLSNTLPDIEKALSKPSTTGTRRKYSKTPEETGRWESFKTEAAGYTYPTTPIGSDISLPSTRGITFNLEKDVDTVIQSHLHNFNRIFEDEGKMWRFRSKATANQEEDSSNFIGVPDFVLTLDSKVLSFVEDKTPNDLPVKHFLTGSPFDLLEMCIEDRQYQQSNITHDDIGRMDVCTVIDQVYGYISVNNLTYGCVTCYDATYFLWRPKRDTLLISHPIFNNSQNPTLLQALYYFVQLVLRDYKDQPLDANPKESDIPSIVIEDMNTDEHIIEGASDSGSNYSTTDNIKGAKFTVGKNKTIKCTLNIESVLSGTVVGSGATGQVIKLKDSNIVVKHCDSYNNREGFKMLKNEIAVYEKLSQHNLGYVPRYYGVCELHGQYFI